MRGGEPDVSAAYFNKLIKVDLFLMEINAASAWEKCTRHGRQTTLQQRWKLISLVVVVVSLPCSGWLTTRSARSWGPYLASISCFQSRQVLPPPLPRSRYSNGVDVPRLGVPCYFGGKDQLDSDVADARVAVHQIERRQLQHRWMWKWRQE